MLLCAAGLFWPQAGGARPFTVAINIWPGAEGLLVASDLSQGQGGRINYVEMSWSTAAMSLFYKRVADAIIVTPDELLRLEDEGAHPRAVMLLGISQGSDAILARHGVAGVESLKGLRVGVEQRSMAEYLLAHALAAHGMSLQDVVVVPLNMAETEEAFNERELDAVVVADPWRIRIQEKGAHVVYDSKDMGLEMCRLLIASERAVEEFPRELQDLVSTCMELMPGLRAMNEGAELDAVLRRQGLTLNQWKKCLGQIRFPESKQDAREMGGERLVECLERMRKLMRKEGLLMRDFDVRPLLSAKLSKGGAP